MNFLIFLAYGAFFIALYPQVIFQGQSFYRPDIYPFYYPIWKFASESIRSGVFPLWNPYSAFGAPFFANVQTCVLYPASVLFYVLPFSFAFNVYIFFHLALACFGTYCLARELGLRKICAFYAGLLFGLSGYASSTMHLVITLASVSYFPWALLWTWRLHKNVTTKNILSLALIYLLQYLAGDPAVLFLTAMVTFTATAARLAYLSIKTKKLDMTLLAGFLLSFLIFLGLSAFQSLSFLEFLRASTRGGQSMQDTSVWSAQWETVVTFFIPKFHDLATMVRADESLKVVTSGVRKQIWLSNPYVGIVPFFFAFYAAAVKRRPAALALVLLGVLSLGLSFGQNSWTYLLVYHLIPALQWIRFPVRFLFPFYLSIALLAGMGVDVLLQNRLPISTKRLWLGLLLFVSIAVGVLNSGSFCKQMTNSLANIFYEGESASQFFTREAAQLMTSQVALSIQRGLLLLCACSLLILLRHKQKLALLLFGLLVVWDLTPMNAKEATVPSAILTAHGPVIDLLQKDKSLFRSMPSPRMVKKIYEIRGTGASEIREQADKLSPNLPLLFRLHSVWNYDSVFLKSAVAGQNLLVRKTIEEGQDWLSLLNVKYMLSPEKSLSEAFEETGASPIGHLFLNKNTLPRAYWIPENAVDAEHHLIPSVALNQFEGATILSYGLNRILMQATCPDKGWLFFSETPYPGWTARVDGINSEVITLNDGFRGLRMNAGNHRVEWNFLPASLIAGCLISLLTVAAILLMKKG